VANIDFFHYIASYCHCEKMVLNCHWLHQ
jgi:hypothetical protein